MSSESNRIGLKRIYDWSHTAKWHEVLRTAVSRRLCASLGVSNCIRLKAPSMNHTPPARYRTTQFFRSRNRGNAVIVALIGLVGVVLAALINKGVIFNDKKVEEAKLPPSKIEQSAPLPSPSAWPSTPYKTKPIIIKNAPSQEAPTTEQTDGTKERVAVCQDNCGSNYSSCVKPARRKLDTCLGKCETLCSVCKSDSCFKSCESCQELCSSSSNDAIDLCKEGFNACKFDCR